MNPNSSVKVRFECGRGHSHEICVDVGRGVPPELRCEPGQGSGVTKGGGGGCPVPEDLSGLVAIELRDNFQESKRRGFVLIRG